MASEARVLMRRPNQAWRQPQVASYTDEAALQKLLLETPDLIPGIDSAAVVDELHLSVGSVDLVAVEPSGSISVVECKLAANSEARRAVIGQIFSYAASLHGMSYEDFDSRFQRRAGQSLLDAVEAVVDDNGPEWDAEAFRTCVADCLTSGSFRLVIAVDMITDELKGIVEYVNTHTVREVDMLAFELGYVADADVEILLPRTHGQESARLKSAQRSRSKRFWSVDEVFAALEELCTDDGVAAVRRLADDAVARGGKLQPGSGAYPTMSAYVALDSKLRALWAVYADPSGGQAARVSLNFGSWRQGLDDGALETIAATFMQHPSLAAPAEAARQKAFKLYPVIPIDEALATDDTVDAIIEALDPYLPPRANEPPR